MVEAIRAALDHALATDPRVVLLGEDIGANGGVFRATDDLQRKYGEARVVDTPVAESGIVGTAFGLAVAGMRPIAEIQFMGFAYPAYDQIVSHVSRIRNRSRHRFTAPMVIRIPYGRGGSAAEHHSESTEAIFAHTPGLKVVVPARPYDAKGLLLAAIEDPDPVIFLEPIRSYSRPALAEEVPDQAYTVPIGAAALAREGDDVTIAAYGSAMIDAGEAADRLESDGVGVDLLDLRTLVPLDAAAVLGSVAKTGRLVVVQEGHRTAGFAAEVAALAAERALYSLAAPVERVTGWDTVVPLKQSISHYATGPDRIVAAVRRALAA